MQKGAERNSLVQSGVDLARIQAAVREMLLAIGEDPDREGLRETPRRIAEMYQELFAGLWQDPARHLQVTFEEGHDELVIVKAIPFHSMCEHHFMPFFGVATWATCPGAGWWASARSPGWWRSWPGAPSCRSGWPPRWPTP